MKYKINVCGYDVQVDDDNEFEKNKIDVLKFCLLLKYKSLCEINPDFKEQFLSIKKIREILDISPEFFSDLVAFRHWFLAEDSLECLLWLKDCMNFFTNNKYSPEYDVDITVLIDSFVKAHPYLQTIKVSRFTT